MVFDIIVRGGIIVDGTGNPAYRADIAISGDTIVKIGDLSGLRGEKEVDATGLIVAPGIVDIHNHSDITIFLDPQAKNLVLQGITTVVIGNCGATPAPIVDKRKPVEEIWKPYSRIIPFKWSSFKEYLDALNSLPKSINLAPLVGYNTIRATIMGFENREPTEREMEAMKKCVENAMLAGAFGLSSGLIYSPGVYGKTEEIVELAKVASRHGGIYATHIRNESDLVVDAVLEAIEIGRRALIPVQIAHHKVLGARNRGKARVTLGLIDHYRENGVNVTVDVYPYTAGMTSLFALLPPWARENGIEETIRKLSSIEYREKVVKCLEEDLGEWENLMYHAGLSGIVIAHSVTCPEYEGLSLKEISEKTGQNPYDVMFELIEKDRGGTYVIVHGISREDMELIIKHPVSMISTDSLVVVYGEGYPHPRFYGTYPKILRYYVRERKLLTLEEAVRKMTSAPATRIGLIDRGLLRPGFKADLLIFNFGKIEDTATYEEPHSYPKGIEYVIVNGEITVEKGEHLGTSAGRLLLKTL